MKTMKFLGMLFAAFALSFTLAACGDDEPAPGDGGNNGGNNGGTNVSVNQLRIGNTTGNIRRGFYAYDSEDNTIYISLDSGESGNYTCIDIELRNLALQNGKIPTGTLPYLGRDVQEAGRPYYFVEGCLNTVFRNDDPVSGLAYGAHEGSGDMKIERNGDTYTITMNNLTGWTMDYANESQYGSFTSTIKFQGRLQYIELEDE